ncbi:MFS general substrate transporter [Obba rivulosa]|uniref:MFS general substrate transporter n=1 Tax=Obba rivulosa TaxID=1052685 RepID=A0A8E2DNB0_9APHY|nr:MFS general substrate transporter [Obba rivulosa]
MDTLNLPPATDFTDNKLFLDTDQRIPGLSKEAAQEHSSQLGTIQPPGAEVDLFPEGGCGWLVVLGCTMYCAVTIGWRQAWGVIQDYFQQNVFPDASDTLMSTMGSVTSMPFLALGGLVFVLSCLTAAFSTQIWQLFITLGVLQGLAIAITFPLIVALPAQWFLKYRAFTAGLVVAGGSLGGALSTVILRAMLTPLGYMKTFAILSGVDAVVLLVAFFLMKERRTVRARQRIIWIDSAFLKDPVFWSLGLCLLFSGFGYLSPLYFLPSFTRTMVPGISNLRSALPLTLLNIAAAFGRATVGFAADRLGPVNALFISIFVSGLAQLVLWTVITNYAGIIAFAIIYGVFCGCFLSLSPVVGAQLYGAECLAGLSGLIMLFSLPGNAAGAPIGGAILELSGNNWRAVAIYSGSMQVVGACCVLYGKLRWSMQHPVAHSELQLDSQGKADYSRLTDPRSGYALPQATYRSRQTAWLRFRPHQNQGMN